VYKGFDWNSFIVKETHTRLQDVMGLTRAKNTIRYNIIQACEQPNSVLPGTEVKGLLLYGAPGNGKTMLAKAIAKECNGTFFNVTAATLKDQFIGQSPKHIDGLWEALSSASPKPSILFLDEVDDMFEKRTPENHAAELVNQFLQKLDGILQSPGVYVIASTNRPYAIDESLVRRLIRVEVKSPKQKARVAIIKNMVKTHHNLTEEDFHEIAKLCKKYYIYINNLIYTRSKVERDRNKICMNVFKLDFRELKSRTLLPRRIRLGWSCREMVNTGERRQSAMDKLDITCVRRISQVPFEWTMRTFQKAK